MKLIVIGLVFIATAVYESHAEDPFSQGRVKPFYCPHGGYPADSDGDGYADICQSEKSDKRQKCRDAAKAYCSQYSMPGYARCLNVRYQQCG